MLTEAQMERLKGNLLGKYESCPVAEILEGWAALNGIDDLECPCDKWDWRTDASIIADHERDCPACIAEMAKECRPCEE